MCNLLRACLSEGYEVFDTVDPEQALGLALEHKPDAILLDLMMPKFSGFELCQSFRSLSYTSTIPILVITGETEAKYKDHCANLGAVAYFEKPLKLDELRRRLAMELQSKRSEQRAHVRVRMRLGLRLRGTEPSGKAFEEITTTRFGRADARYKVRKLIVFSGYFSILLFLAFLFEDRLGRLTFAFGIAGAGVAVALQDVVASIAGAFSIGF